MCYGEYFPNPGSLASSEAPYAADEHARLIALMSEPGACLAEVIGTLILALVICAVTDAGNPAGPQRLAPAFIGLTVSALICVLAPLTQACFNPARDFGPRLFAFLAGWGSVAIPGPNGNTGFVTVYILSPIIGAILGIGLYDKVLGPAMVVVEQAPGSSEDHPA
jgi:glycerol uptake facilitator protein